MQNRIWIVLCVVLSVSLGAQEDAGPGTEPGAGSDSGPELPRQFRGISLGMGLEELKTALAADALFSFRGDRDVSFLPDPQQNLVETTGLSFVKRAFFQLNGGALFIMAFTMNTDLVDYYSLFTALTEKYGPPDSLNPRQSVWENGSTRLALERPLTVKYIDLGVFNEIVGDSTVQETHELRLRQEFIDAF
ncbi:MAG: hypothetical protein LBD96_06075 [Treponema sp.]|jgi:hypothetical protein|nr:hypothetical protein [Treponema sp.]